MRSLRIEKITLNVGAGKDQGKLEKGIKLLKMLTGVDPNSALKHTSWNGISMIMLIAC